MPTDQIEDTLEEFRQYVDRLGDEVRSTEDFEAEIEGEDVRFHWLTVEEQAYDCVYQIVLRDDYEDGLVRYGYDLIGNIASSIEHGPDDEVYDLEEFVELDPRDASLKIINRVSDQDIQRLRFQLHDKISNPQTISTITSNEDAPLTGFEVLRHTFPNEDDFGIDDFYDSVTAVTSSGEIGARYLNNSFAIQVPEDAEEFSITFDPGEVFS